MALKTDATCDQCKSLYYVVDYSGDRKYVDLSCECRRSTYTGPASENGAHIARGWLHTHKLMKWKRNLELFGAIIVFLLLLEVLAVMALIAIDYPR